MSEEQNTEPNEEQAPVAAEFENLKNEGEKNISPDEQVELILDIPVTIALELGKTKISIRELLQLSQGSVVELDKAVGEPLDLLVNDVLIAHGEVVIIENEKFGIRLTDVISPSERISKLN